MRLRYITLILLGASFCGCKSLNENPANERFWFPTLEPPSKAEKAARASNFPDGGDPFVDAEVGPRSFNTRPRGWEIQRSKTTDVLGGVSDSDE